MLFRSYLMHLGNDPFEVDIVNTGKVVRNQTEFVREVIMQDLLEAEYP